MANKKLPSDEIMGGHYDVVRVNENFKDLLDLLNKRDMELWRCYMKSYTVFAGPNDIIIQGSVMDNDLLLFVKALRASGESVVCNFGKPANPPTCPPGVPNCNPE